MNKEQALKLLLESIENDKRFALLEYEALFLEDGVGYYLSSDFALYLDGAKLFTLSRDEIGKNQSELILDTLLKSLYNVLSVEVIELKKVKEKRESLLKTIQLKEGRMERQTKNTFLSDSQRKSLSLEMENLQKSMEMVTDKMNRLYKLHPQVQLIHHLEEMRNSAQ